MTKKDEIIKLFKNGVNIYDIENQTQFKPGYISQVISQYRKDSNLKPKAEEIREQIFKLLQEGYEVPEVAKKVHVSRQYVYKVVKNHWEHNSVPFEPDNRLTLLNDDCIEVMRRFEIPEKSLDAIITDPPYEISMMNNFHTMGRTGVDFGEWDYDSFYQTFMHYCFDLLKPGGSIIVFNKWQNLGRFANVLEGEGFETKDLIRWEKSNPMPRNISRRYALDCEYAIWAVKPGGKWTFNKSVKGYRRPKYICSSESGLHTTQKPLKLMEDLIRVHTNFNDVVFDPFMGSGTTGAACLKHGRCFIGIEKDKNYFCTATKRLGSYGLKPYNDD